jgi:2-hydroxy-3-keto-5-methylthiopentenyl-1-phosphate phosphatase
LRLVLDWDGTVTVRDSLVDAVRTFGDAGVYGRSFDSYGEALATEVGTIRASAAEVSAWAAEHVQVRPGFATLAGRYEPVIVSSGLPQLIRPVLAREGIDVELRSNDAEPAEDGWRLRFREPGLCPVCGDKCKRAWLPEGEPLVYVGDGVSDTCAALASDRVFARDQLAKELVSRGVPFESFETLDDVAAALP